MTQTRSTCTLAYSTIHKTKENFQSQTYILVLPHASPILLAEYIEMEFLGQSRSGPRLEGYLFKRGIRTGRNWKKRYFLLEASKQRLWYFKAKGDCKPRGEFVVNKSTTVAKSSARENAIEISNLDAKLSLVVSAETKEEFQQWLSALQLVSGKNTSGNDIVEEESKVSSKASYFRKALFRRSSTSDMSTGTKSAEEEAKPKREVHTFTASSTKFVVDKRYTFEKPIGMGAYGVVVAAHDSVKNEKVAIKKVSKAFDDLVDAKRILREIKLLRHFDHENIIHIKDLLPPTDYDNFEEIYIVSELMETDLHRVIYSKQRLSEEHIQYFIYQLLRALRYIHSAKVIHRDLKPSNLLVNANCDLKVCDFGLARGMEDVQLELTEYVVTRWYRAPEIMLACRNYSNAIDVWSVGCIFAELLGKKPLFPGEDYIHQLQLIIACVGTPKDEDLAFISSEKARNFVKSQEFSAGKSFANMFPKASAPAIDQLMQMLVFNPEKRISVDKALAHPFLKSLHQSDDEPVHKKVFMFDDSMPDELLNKKAIQEQILEEIYHFHPEERKEAQNGSKPGRPLKKRLSRTGLFSR